MRTIQPPTHPNSEVRYFHELPSQKRAMLKIVKARENDNSLPLGSYLWSLEDDVFHTEI